MKIQSPTRLILAAMIPLLIGSSCMKTRAQIRREAEGESRPAAAPDGTMRTQVTEVPVDSGAVDELRSELQRLAGRLEELERTNQELTQKNTGKTEEAKQLETRIQELEASQLELIEALKKKEKETPKADPLAIYEQGKKQHKAKEHAAAIASFDEYLKFPKGKRIEQAYFLRAESHFAQKQYRKAILDYSTVQEKFPKTAKMPHILMKIGQAFEAMGEKADAKIFFQELVDKYPRSTEAKKVASKLN